MRLPAFLSRLSPWARGLSLGLGLTLGLILALAAVLETAELKRPVAGLAARAVSRPVSIEGSARAHIFTLTPRLIISGLRIGQPDWLQAQQQTAADMAQIERITVEARLLPLFRGALILTRVEIDKPALALFRDPSGRTNWSTADMASTQAARKPVRLPAIRNFTIRDGRVIMVDQERGLSFEGKIWSSETPGDATRQPFRFKGIGKLNGKPFDLDMSGDSLLHVEPKKPYSFQARLAADGTRIEARGTILRPFDFGVLDGVLTLEGEDLADLYELTGLALPNTPPYAASSALHRDGTTLVLKGFAGRIGKSDITGDVTIETGRVRPMMTASLHAKSLDVKDLGALLGGDLPEADRPAEAPPAKDAHDKPPRLLLPDAALDLKRVRGMDAKVRFSADALRLSPAVAMKEAVLTVLLENGQLSVNPLTVELPQGRLIGKIEIDARQDTPKSMVDLTLRNAHLEDLIKTGEAEPPAEGVVQARVTLRGVGRSVHRTAAVADGQLAIVIPHGEMRQTFAELTGIDVAEGLSLLLAKDTRQVAMHCGVANFDVRHGQVRADTFTLDTDVVRIDGSGQINLATEAIDLKLQGKPKHPSLRVRAPVTVGGTLRSPTVGVGAKELAAQAGVAGVLGALLTPLGSLLAFIDPGLAEDADCAQLFAEARQKGAPVPQSQ